MRIDDIIIPMYIYYIIILYYILYYIYICVCVRACVCVTQLQRSIKVRRPKTKREDNIFENIGIFKHKKKYVWRTFLKMAAPQIRLSCLI